MAAPAFAKLLLLKQTINDTGDSFFRTVLPHLFEQIDLLRLWWQADQIETQPPENLPGFCVVSRMHTRTFQLRQNEPIDIRLRPVSVRNFGRRLFDRLFVRPEVFLCVLNVFFGNRRLQFGNGIASGIRCAHFDPRLEVVDDILRELAFGRHHVVFVIDRVVQPALFQVAGNDSRTGAATDRHEFLRVQPQPAAHITGLVGVASVALLNQNRPDFGLEEFQFVRRQVIGRCYRGRQDQD